MEILPIVYCLEVKDTFEGSLYQNQLIKSIKQLKKMAALAKKKVLVHVLSTKRSCCPSGCIWIDASDINQLCKTTMHMKKVKSFSTFWRLFIAWSNEFKNFDTVLYLDSDTWCINTNFFKIFDRYIGDNDCIGVRDIVVKEKQSKKLLEDFGIKLSISTIENLKNKLYINAGVLLLSLKNIKLHFKSANGLIDEISKLYQIADLHYADQDIINLLFRITFAPYKYNTLVNSLSVKVSCDKWMLHFTGNVFRHQQYKDEFPDYRINRYKDYIYD